MNLCDALAIVMAFLLVVGLVYHWRAVSKLRAEIDVRAKTLFEEWSRSVLEVERRRIEEALRKELEEEYRLRLKEWVQEKEREIREDAIKRSVSVVIGKVGEHLAPFIVAADIGADPRDFRFIGSPIDYIVFRGLSRGKPEEIVFVEVKTGKTERLTEREKAVKSLVEQCKVSWKTISLYRLVKGIYESTDKIVETIVDEQVKEPKSSQDE